MTNYIKSWSLNRVLFSLMLVALSAPLSIHAQQAADSAQWYPSKWGKDDTLGSVNEINAASIIAAASLVKEGKRYALGQVTGRSTPAFGSRTFELFAVSHGGVFDGTSTPIGSGELTTNDDWALVYFGVGSQIDGLGHVGIDHVYYNGNRVEDFYHPGGLKKLSTANIPPIVARGIVLDIVAYLREHEPDKLMTVEGHEMLKGGVAVNRKEIMGALERQNIALGTGDVVLLHTGYMALADIDQAAYKKSLPGIGRDGALFLAEHNPVAVGADTFATEVLPGEVEGLFLPAHSELITKRGIYILENMVTHELVADEAWEFMFVLGQARMEGAVQMIINPVAIR